MDSFFSKDKTFTQVAPGGLVAMSRVVVAARYNSSPIRRAVRRARSAGVLVDLTYGYACTWVLFLDSGHLVLATDQIFQMAPFSSLQHEEV